MFNEIKIDPKHTLQLERFREMDYYTVAHYHLPIELMMENAGLQLANLIAFSAIQRKTSILIGVGNGNNGGGGLVAARRLAAWGFNVYLDMPATITKELPLSQLERAKKYGVNLNKIEKPDIWVDAYLGFSQKLPLRKKFEEAIIQANSHKAHKISLDIPTGFMGLNTKTPYFQPHKILTLAAAKTILTSLPNTIDQYLADLGIPEVVYKRFGINIPPFQNQNIVKIKYS